MGQLLLDDEFHEDVAEGRSLDLPEAQKADQVSPSRQIPQEVGSQQILARSQEGRLGLPLREGRDTTPQKHGQTPIKRHTKVQNRRSPYESDWVYWETRTARHPQLPKRVARLLRRQKGKCPWCGLHFKDGELLEVDHVIPTAKGGEDLPNNQQLLHGHCHDEKTVLDFSSVKGANDNSHTIEEPDDGSLSRPVLKTNHRG
jgi:5-methylcytosine-specific restriction endonuclease McrA